MWGGAQGIDHAIWPQKMEVDYVRVYEADDGTAVESQSWGQVKVDERRLSAYIARHVLSPAEQLLHCSSVGSSGSSSFDRACLPVG